MANKRQFRIGQVVKFLSGGGFHAKQGEIVGILVRTDEPFGSAYPVFASNILDGDENEHNA